MSDEQPSEVLGALPRTRPHRRSDKRGAPQAEAERAGAEGRGQPERPASTQPKPRSRATADPGRKQPAPAKAARRPPATAARKPPTTSADPGLASADASPHGPTRAEHQPPGYGRAGGR